MMDFLADRYGPYPFDSNGALSTAPTGIGYALEVQGKSHYPGNNAGTASINVSTQLHEISHQWFGNSATLAGLERHLVQRGLGAVVGVELSVRVGTGRRTRQSASTTTYAATAEDWSIAPTDLDGDPANLFLFFPTYVRGAMTIEGYRQIVGDDAFFRLGQAIQSRFAFDNVSTAEFIAVGGATARASAAPTRALLRDYFQQWLYGKRSRRSCRSPSRSPCTTVGGMEAREVALLLTDVESSTRLLVRHGQSGVVALGRVSAVVSAVASEHGGEVSTSARGGRQRCRAVHVGRRGGCRRARRERAVGCRALAGRRAGRRAQRGPRR